MKRFTPWRLSNLNWIIRIRAWNWYSLVRYLRFLRLTHFGSHSVRCTGFVFLGKGVEREHGPAQETRRGHCEPLRCRALQPRFSTLERISRECAVQALRFMEWGVESAHLEIRPQSPLPPRRDRCRPPSLQPTEVSTDRAPLTSCLSPATCPTFRCLG